MARNHYTKPRNPDNPADLARALADPVSAAELFGGSPEQWSAFEAEYAQNSRIVAKLAGEQAQLQMQQMLQAGGGHAVPKGIGGTAAAGRNRLWNKRAPGVKADGVLEHSEYPLTDLFKAVDPRNEAGGPVRLALQNAMSERVGSEGGYLVPEVLRSEILTLGLESAIVRPRAMIVEMDSLRVPYPAIDDVSHSGTSGVYGGVAANWTEEGASITSSAPAFGKVILQARKLAFFTNIPNELLQDAGPVVEQWLRTQLPRAVSWFEDIAYIGGSATAGTGVNQPQGFLNSPSCIRVPVGATNTVRYDDVVKMYCRLLPQALPGAVWIMAPDVKEQLLKLAVTPLSAGTTQAVAPPAWLSGLQAIDGEPSTLFGHPVCISEKAPSGASGNTTTPGALSLANFGYYLLGDRMQMQVAVSEQYQFASDLTSYRVIMRCDGRAWTQSALTPFNGGNTLSPFVKLDTTATS